VGNERKGLRTPQTKLYLIYILPESSNKGISTRDVGIQTDINLVNCSDKDGEFSANTCNMLSVDFEGLKLEVTILESRINGEIRVNGNAIDQVRADVAVIQSQLGIYFKIEIACTIQKISQITEK
jgi:hypothetical protein